MGTAYTPGLKVSARSSIVKIRRLPLKGVVLVKEGDHVLPDTVVAKTELPGIMQTVKLAEQMGLEPNELASNLLVSIGDTIRKGMPLARTRGLFGLFKTEVKASLEGVLEVISEQTGHIQVRQASTPIERDAYIQGIITRVIPDEGVEVRCTGAVVQGIFGVGGERQGYITLVTSSAAEDLTEELINESHNGMILVGGRCITAGALRKAAKVGAAGLVAGGIVDRELIGYLREALNDPGFDIGVAITGQEPIAFSLVITEGFGSIQMAEHTYSLLKSLVGKRASINGATQIRAGVIRPEIIVPQSDDIDGVTTEIENEGLLVEGASIRIIREPYFGLLGIVTALPSKLTMVESETWVRVLTARLEDGSEVTVPRANVELIEN